MSENKKEEDIAQSMNPEEMPDLQDYKSADKGSADTHMCQDCNKVFSSIEELTTHYKKEHPESF